MIMQRLNIRSNKLPAFNLPDNIHIGKDNSHRADQLSYLQDGCPSKRRTGQRTEKVPALLPGESGNRVQSN